MTGKELLEEAISQANKDLSRLEEEYWNIPPGERETAIWAQNKQEKIENLRDAIDSMSAALELLKEDYE